MKKILLIMLGILLVSSLVLALEVTQQVTVTVLPGAIDVYSPVQDAIYTERMVPINLRMSAEVSYFKYKDNGERLRTLCRNCDEYGYYRRKRKPFDDGFHQLTIFAIFESGEVTELRNFTVDTKDPKITKTEPRRGFATGDFSVEYQEANPVSLFMNYGNDAVGWRNAEVELSTCYEPRRSRMKCDVAVDLTDYDLQEISYWFNITDILGQYDESKPRDLDVDVSKPVLNNPDSYWSYTLGERYIYFSFNITELNFDEINYLDEYEGQRGTPRFRRLCSRLRDGICEKRKSFRRGTHDITIEILDDAGNREELKIEDLEIEY